MKGEFAAYQQETIKKDPIDIESQKRKQNLDLLL